ncbi:MULTISPECIES: acetyl-CoA carboxylase biotin carboxylase subunit family protein [unclassified Pantoea]|uniref:ATP-grasp domain-containing protein n=1 Tax=unclassified Pantoea TaxID=2630326 RepID=UPI0021197D3A|nr:MULTISPECIES: ATP-grasp domain-containing protein [unclassified Pantoea]
MKKIFLQIGATRDGQNPYCAVAKRDGYFTVLAEMGDFVDYQSLSLALPFDLIIRLDRPENPWEVMQAYLHAGLLAHPLVVLAGFEAYNASAGRLREMLAGPDAPAAFIPLDKYAQRMALKKAWPRFPQPEFRFFASPLSILDAGQALIYPCVVKPVDGGGGLGIWLIEHADQLHSVVKQLVQTMNYGGRGFSGFIVESALIGDEFSLQGVVHQGHPQALTCCQKVIEQHRDAEGCVSFYESGHVAMAAAALPASFSSLMTFCCETFGYRQGAFHIDFIVVNGVPHFLEMGFRLSGMGVATLVHEATGINWAEVTFRLEAGGALPVFAFTTPGAVGQLRLRQPAQLQAAERWIDQHQQGALLPPLRLPALQVSSRSSLYADLTRHAGILATFSLTATAREPIMTTFQQVIAAQPVAAGRDKVCAG